MTARTARLLLVAASLVLICSKCAGAQPWAKVTIERDVEYGRAGDRPLVLDIIRPKQPAKGPLPVICFIHGGGWAGGNKRGGALPLTPFAASGDYFCVSVGYRLSGEAPWPAQIHDCKAAVRWLRAGAKKYNLDPERIGVWGASAGGHLVSMLGTSGGVKELEGDCGSAGQSSRVACVLNFFGPTDLTPMAKNPDTQKWVVMLIDKLLGGPVDQKKDLARQASPVTYVSKDDPPFLTMHGSKDKVVPPAQAVLLHEALKKAGADSTLVVVEGAGHGFGGPQVAERITAFFDKHLRGRDVKVSGEPIRRGKPPKKEK